MSEDQRNLFIAVILSVLVFLGFNYMFPKPVQEVPVKIEEKKTIISQNIEETKPIGPTVDMANGKVKAKINLKGCFIDEVTLNEYKEGIDKDSAPISLLDSIIPRTVWVSAGVSDIPDENAIWTLDSENEKEKTFIYNNGRGLKYKRTISVDDEYLFTVTDSVESLLNDSVTLGVKSEVLQIGTPKTSNNWILHEGAVGVLNDKLQECVYKDFNKPVSIDSIGGWIGFTDKYFLVAVIPQCEEKTLATLEKKTKSDVYSVNFLSSNKTLEPGKSITFSSHIFVGPKVLSLLENYQDKYKISKFHLAVDFGFLYFLTKPLFLVLNLISSYFGNFGVAILILTVVLKILMLPLAARSFKSMGKMKNLAPKIEKIKQIHGSDRVKLNQELMEFYKKEGINPVSGCLPVIIQAPIFFCLYKVLFVTIEMRHAPFFGWLKDLSAPDPTNLFNLFGLIPWTPPSFLSIGILPIIMGITMVVQQKLNPPPADPAQAKAMMILPFFFTFLFASFPSGLVLYWAWSNVLTIMQQMFIQKRMMTKI